MNKVFTYLFLFIVFKSQAQNIEGRWNGILKIQTTELRIAFNITKIENGYKSTMDSPDQGAFGIPVTKTDFNGTLLKIEANNIGVIYNGEYKDNKIVGIFQQAGQKINLDLIKNEDPKQEN